MMARSYESNPVQVRLRSNVHISSRSETAFNVLGETHLTMTALAVVESMQTTARNVPHDLYPASEHAVRARALSAWLQDDSSAIVLLTNTADHGINLPGGKAAGYVFPLIPINPVQTISVVSDSSMHDQGRNDVKRVLMEAFRNTTFDEQQEGEVLDIGSKYFAVFSLTPKELGRCTTTRAMFPLQPETTPMNPMTYGVHRCVQEAIKKCVDQVQEDDVIKTDEVHGEVQ